MAESQWHSTYPPAPLSLPLLPVWAGLPEGSQVLKQRKENTLHHLQAGDGSATKGVGGKGKTSPPALAEGERVQKQEKKRWRMVAVRGALPSMPLSFGTGLGYCPWFHPAPLL